MSIQFVGGEPWSLDGLEGDPKDVPGLTAAHHTGGVFDIPRGVRDIDESSIGTLTGIL
jgi:hypothetical protein